MLYIFYGTDQVLAREKARGLISGLQAKAPDAELVRITDDAGSSVDIDGLLGTQGLFKQNYILFLDNIDSAVLGFSDTQLKAMQSSEHICVVLMGKLLVGQKRQVEQHADKIVEYKAAAQPRNFDAFNAANALKARNKQKLWQELATSRISGSEGEAIVGMLFWAVKDMLVKGQFNKYSETELNELAVSLAALPHKARRRGISTNNALEEFALTQV